MTVGGASEGAERRKLTPVPCTCVSISFPLTFAPADMCSLVGRYAGDRRNRNPNLDHKCNPDVIPARCACGAHPG